MFSNKLLLVAVALLVGAVVYLRVKHKASVTFGGGGVVVSWKIRGVGQHRIIGPTYGPGSIIRHCGVYKLGGDNYLTIQDRVVIAGYTNWALKPSAAATHSVFDGDKIWLCKWWRDFQTRLVCLRVGNKQGFALHGGYSRAFSLGFEIAFVHQNRNWWLA